MQVDAGLMLHKANRRLAHVGEPLEHQALSLNASEGDLAKSRQANVASPRANSSGLRCFWHV